MGVPRSSHEYEAHAVVQALDQGLGVRSTGDFLLASLSDIELLSDAGLSRVQVKLLSRLRDWAPGKITANDWTDLTIDALVVYTDTLESQRNSFNQAVGALALTQAGQAQVKTAEELYKNRVKVDTKAYPELKLDEKFRSWWRATRATAKNQGIARVFDPKFVPSTLADDEKAVFDAQQATGMEILVNNCKTRTSLAIIRRHEADGTAHACFKELHDYFLTGSNAERAAAKAETELRDMRLDNDYPQSFVSFFNSWENKLLDLEEFSGETLDDKTKRKWFENSIRHNDLFRQESSSAKRIRDKQGELQSFDDWFDQMKEFASETDDVNANKKKLVGLKLKANQVKQTKGNSQSTGRGQGRGHGARSAGNESNGGRGRGRGQGRGGSAPASNTITSRRVDPNIWHSWSADQQAAYREETRRIRDAERGGQQRQQTQVHQAATATPGAPPFRIVPVPSTTMTVASSVTQPTMAPGRGTQVPRGHAMRAFHSQQQPSIAGSQQAAQPEFQATDEATGHTYSMFRTNCAKIKLRVSQALVAAQNKSLIDRGANGSIAGKDMMCIDLSTTQFADVTGIDDHVMEGLPLGTFAAKVWTCDGPVIVWCYQYAYGNTETTIHSVVQLEDWKNQVFDKSAMLGGRQLMITLEGYVIPFTVMNGLVHLKMQHFTEEEFMTLPHVILTSDAPWDPTKYDGELSPEAVQQATDTSNEEADHDSPTLRVNNVSFAMQKANARIALFGDEYVEQLSLDTGPVSENPRFHPRWEYMADDDPEEEPLPLPMHDAQYGIAEAPAAFFEFAEGLGFDEDGRNGQDDLDSVPPLLPRGDDASSDASSYNANARNGQDDLDSLPSLLPRDDDSSDGSIVPPLVPREDDDSSNGSSLPGLVPRSRRPVANPNEANSVASATSNDSGPPPLEENAYDDSSTEVHSTVSTIASINAEDSDDDSTVVEEEDVSDYLQFQHFEYGEDAGSVFSQRELQIYAATVAAGNASAYSSLAGRPARTVIPANVDIAALRPNFGFLPEDRIKETLKNTTQFYRAENRYPPRRHLRSRFPGANVRRLPGKVAMDTMFSDTPALDDGILGHGGCTQVQLFVAIESRYIRVYPMANKGQVPQVLMQFINDCGAPIGLISDGAKEATSRAVQDIERQMMIRSHDISEPENQQQNPAERVIGDVERTVNVNMDRAGSPAPTWLLCTLHIVALLCLISQARLNGMTPHQAVYGEVPDLSPYLCFHWWQKVRYSPNSTSLDKTNDRAGYFVGVADHVGDALTFVILDDETHQCVFRSLVRPREDRLNPNLRLDLPNISASAEGEMFVYTEDGLEENFRLADLGNDEEESTQAENLPTYFQDEPLVEPEPYRPPPSARAQANPSGPPPKLPTFSPEELVARSFVHTLPDGQQVQAQVVRKLETIDAANHQNIKMLLKLGDGEVEDVMDYIKLCDIFEALDAAKDNDPNRHWIFQAIVDHKGPFNQRSKHWQGSMYNVKVRWEDGTESWEPLNVIAKDDPVTCALYARDHGLTDTIGWKFISKLSRRTKLLQTRVNKAMAARRSIRHKFGVKIPRDSNEARKFQEEAGHTKWTDAEQEELQNLFGYDTFKDLGPNGTPPEGFQKIRMIWVYDCKHDFRYRARLVAGGHVTPPSDDSYSSVVSLEIMRLALAVGELNGLTPMVGDIGNAYLEATTKEKIYFVAGPEFGDLQGHIMVVYKALYGLRTSGARFHERLADALRIEGFLPSLADPDLWFRDAGDCYEYICVWVDDLMAILKDPAAFFEALRATHKFKLKGVGHPEYHLGGDFGRDPDGTLYWGSKTYVTKLLANYERLFGGPPAKYSSPLDPHDHPELDQSPFLRESDIKVYQSLVGALQWAITLSRIDICTAVACLSRFRAQPREGHLERVKRICGYLRKFPDAAIRFRVQWPANEVIFGDTATYDWQQTVYGKAKEDILSLWPKPKGKLVRLTTMKDANLMHCKVTGKACSGILHYINQTPFKWWSKLQDTVENATFGSEIMSGRVAVDQIFGTRASLRAMGVPLESTTWLLGDNQSVITQCTIPSSTLSKRHNALAYHRIRWAVAAGVVKFVKIPGKENAADALTKYLAYNDAWPLLKPILFWKGETLEAQDIEMYIVHPAHLQGECHIDRAITYLPQGS